MNEARADDYPMLPYEEVWRLIASSLSPLAPVRCDLARAAGLVLAEDVTARENMPPFAAASMDGYAVIASDTSTTRAIIGEQEAGPQREFQVKAGVAVRIMTGGALPEGADAVIPFEKASEVDGTMHPQGQVDPGANVRPVGQDIRQGEVALKKGIEIGPPEIGLLASLNYAEVLVHPRPRVFLITTGDELVRVGAPLKPGQIRDANNLALLAAVRSIGCEALSRPDPVGDNLAALEQAIRTGFAKADMVVTSGGVSMGTHDYIKPIISRIGRILVGRAAIKPGKPLTYAMVGNKPFFGLPGFPVSSLVCFEQFVRPALRILGGHKLLWRPQVKVRLAQTLHHDPERTEFQRVIVYLTSDRRLAYTTGAQGSGRLKSMVGANALVMLPAGTGDAPAGSEVLAVMLTIPEIREEM
ncbi:MAG: molybdopterin molybdotransferase MoeA [Chloroflexi bacterium]|nr:molybdopterin molybdotransferase MoeA [Chloroflexota bacterium]